MKFPERYYTAIAVQDVAPVIRRFGGTAAEGVLRVPRDMKSPIEKELARLGCPGVKVLANDRATSAGPEDYEDAARIAKQSRDKQKAEQQMIAGEELMRRAR